VSARQSGAALRLAPPPAAPARVRVKRAPGPLGVVGQVRLAFAAKNRLATALGALLGGAVPVGSYQLAHHEIDLSLPLWAQLKVWLVLGGLVFSAITVFSWGKLAYGSGWKAAGFAVILEGVLLTSTTPWLAAGALVYLVAINAVATGCNLTARRVS
jgi:hypothetical protein